MARPLRIQYPGAVYHVTCRGNDRKNMVKDDGDRKQFVQILAQSVAIYDINLCSYVLMDNHFHLLVETPQGNLAEFMRRFNLSYTGYFNRRYRRSGHVYQGRYKSILVEKEGYLSVLSRYIHLNPVKIKAMKKVSEKEKVGYLMRYPWSSLPGFIHRKKKEAHVDYAMVLEEYGGDTERARKAYRARIVGEISENPRIWGQVLGQSLLGSDGFIAWVKEHHLEAAKDRERPSVAEVHRYRSEIEILKAIEAETGKDLEAIRSEKGVVRQIAMDLLYRAAGLKGPAIGHLFEIGYGPVSQERKRLREKLAKDRNLRKVLGQIENRLATNEI